AGRQAHDRLVAPALTGIYAGDTASLSMAAVFPKIVEMEREHGSLLKAFLGTLMGRRKSAPKVPPDLHGPQRPKPKGSVFSFVEGVQTLPQRLTERVPIRYQVTDARVGDAPVTVLATPAAQAATLVQSSNPALSALLQRVQYAPMVVAAVSLPDHSF